MTKLIAKVMHLFGNVTKPSDCDLVATTHVDDEECTDLAKYLTHRSNCEVTLSDLKQNYSHDFQAIIHFMTPEAIKYYFPSLTAMMIQTRSECTLLTDAFVSMLAATTKGKMFWQLLSSTQQDVTIDVLKQLRDTWPSRRNEDIETITGVHGHKRRASDQPQEE